MKKTPRPAYRSDEQWAIWNGNVIWGGTHRTRTEAIKYVVEQAREPWSKCRRYMAVRPCRIVPR